MNAVVSERLGRELRALKRSKGEYQKVAQMAMARTCQTQEYYDAESIDLLDHNVQAMVQYVEEDAHRGINGRFR